MLRFSIKSSSVLFALIIAGAGSISAAPTNLKNFNVSVLRSNTSATALAFTADRLEAKTIQVQGVEYDAFLEPGEGTTYERNMPILPAVSRFVVVPPDAGLELVVNPGEARYFHKNNPPAICDDTTVVALQRDAAPDGIYPAVFAEMSEPLVIRGVRLVKITTYPLQYDFINRQYIHRPRIEAEVRCTNDAPVNPIINPARRYRSPVFKEIMEAMAINGAEAFRDDPPEPRPYNGHYLVVIREECIPYARNWIEFRRKTGYKMDICRSALTTG
ncbi:MAG: hypothetical protein FJY65_00705 [Calditrichaeota bacterium]|nr:hypothetical protein [Calditrichota bacterium]